METAGQGDRSTRTALPDESRIAESYDAVLIGGGPAGSALAALLARAGRRVALCERDRFPRDKLCGEFLSGESRRVLGKLGCLAELDALQPAAIHACRFTSPSGAVCSASLPSPALGISRRALDAVLLRHAARSGVAVLQGAQVCRVEASAANGSSPLECHVHWRPQSGANAVDRLTASLVVAAHGRRAQLDRELDRAFMRRAHPYVGLKRHHRPRTGTAGGRLAAELDGFVEVHAFHGGYCGMSFVESGVVNVCMLVTEAFLAGLPSSRWEDVRDGLCRANPRLAERLAALEPNEETVHAVAGIPFSFKERSSGPVFFVGDAAGMIAPFCGDGQAMALRSALLLGDLILQSPSRLCGEDCRILAQRWEQRWRREFGFRMRLGRWLQPLLLRGWTADAALRLATLAPKIPDWIARATRGA